MNASVERMCRAILVLYHPFRTLQDLTVDGSFHKKFKRLFHNGVPHHITEVLSNVQMFYNSMRLPAKEDPLRHCTTPFESSNNDDNNHDSDGEDDDNFFDGMFDVLNPPSSPPIQQQDSVQMTLKAIRKDGARGCGFYDLPPACAPTNIHEHNERVPTEFITSLSGQCNARPNKNGNNVPFPSRDMPNPYTLMTLIYRNTRRRIQEALSSKT